MGFVILIGVLCALGAGCDTPARAARDAGQVGGSGGEAEPTGGGGGDAGQASGTGGAPAMPAVESVSIRPARCVPAECRTAADCGGEPCLMSYGNAPDDCCVYGQLGLFCKRPDSTCQHGGDCPGNGQACLYSDPKDYFECQILECDCD